MRRYSALRHCTLSLGENRHLEQPKLMPMAFGAGALAGGGVAGGGGGAVGIAGGETTRGGGGTAGGASRGA
eukprot:2438231-Lingulodinium_polyedra.AAC.1